MPARSRITLILRRWHRRIGLILCVPVVIITLSGIVAQWSHSLKLDHTYVRSPLLLDLYGIALEPLGEGYLVNNQWLTQIQDTLYWNQSVVASCEGKLRGATQQQNTIFALCEHEVVLLTPSGEMIEKIPTPLALQKLGKTHQKVVAANANNVLMLEWELGEWGQPLQQEAIEWSVAKPLPPPLQALLSTQNTSGISVEKLLLDIHSGRLFGAVGEIIVSVSGIFLLLLAISGAISGWRR